MSEKVLASGDGGREGSVGYLSALLTPKVGVGICGIVVVGVAGVHQEYVDHFMADHDPEGVVDGGQRQGGHFRT